MITTARRKLEADLTNLIKAIAYWDIHVNLITNIIIDRELQNWFSRKSLV